MVSGEVVSNLSDFVSALPPEIASRIGGIITLLQAVGVAFIVYVIYLVVNFVLNFKRHRRLKVIESKVGSIERKLDKLIKKRR